MKVRTEGELHAQEHVSEDGRKFSISASLEQPEDGYSKVSRVAPTGITYRATFFRLSKTRRPNSIDTGIEVNLLSNKIIAAEEKSLSR